MKTKPFSSTFHDGIEINKDYEFTNKKLTKILSKIQSPVFEGIYCLHECIYKNDEKCTMFGVETGYNFRLNKAKRVKSCLSLFKEAIKG